MSNRMGWLLAGAAVIPLAAPAAAYAQAYRFHYDHVLGTSLDVTAMASDKATALMAVSAARGEIARLDAILSAWREDGELARLNRGEIAQVSPALFDVLTRCEAWRTATEGAFDCRVGAPLAVWRSAGDASVDAAALDRSLAQAGKDIRFDVSARAVARAEGQGFTVDGMAKGYIIDAALSAARQATPNLHGLMIDIGGDLRCWGAAPKADGWRIGVGGESADNVAPDLAILISDGAVAASGRGQRDLTAGGCSLSHTLDPATARPVEGVRHAVVKAGSAADADALATAFMVMKPEAAVAMADRMDGVEALITDAGGVRHASAGWNDLVDREPRPQLIRAAATASAGFGLDMTYTVPKIEFDPYHAPYTIVWVTDADRKLVRNVMILGQKPRWAPENYIWWRRYGRLLTQPLEAVAKPTRLPGRYTLHWDGKDEAGQPVAAGNYILHIEAAREKGGHTYQTVDFTLGGAAGAKALAAKDEMGAVELRYGPGR